MLFRHISNALHIAVPNIQGALICHHISGADGMYSNKSLFPSGSLIASPVGHNMCAGLQRKGKHLLKELLILVIGTGMYRSPSQTSEDADPCKSP